MLDRYPRLLEFPAWAFPQAPRGLHNYTLSLPADLSDSAARVQVQMKSKVFYIGPLKGPIGGVELNSFGRAHMSFSKFDSLGLALDAILGWLRAHKADHA